MKQLSRGVRAFLLLWLLIVLLPPLRRQTWRQVVPNIFTIFTVNNDRYADEKQMEPMGSLTGTPDGIAGQQGLVDSGLHRAIAALVKQPYYNFGLVLQPYYKLIARHPDTLWIKADALRFATMGGVPEITTSSGGSAKPQITIADRVHLVAIARSAEIQQPDNAYFPLMEALFQFSLKQYPATWRAIDRSAACRTYDDYTRAEVLRRIHIAEAVRTVSWQERWRFFEDINTPHLSQFRELSRRVRAIGALAHLSGNNQLALKYFEADLKMGRAFQKDAYSPINPAVGQAIEVGAWWTALGSPQMQNLTSAAARSNQRIQVADAYATLITSWGAPPKMAQASREDARKFLSRRIPNFGWFAPISVVPQIKLALQGEWLGAWLARFGAMAALAFLLGCMLRRWTNIAPSKRAVTSCTLFSCAGMLVATVLCLVKGVGTYSAGSLFAYILGYTPQDALPSPGIVLSLGWIQALESKWYWIIVILWLMPPFFWWMRYTLIELYKAPQPPPRRWLSHRKLSLVLFKETTSLRYAEAVLWTGGVIVVGLTVAAELLQKESDLVSISDLFSLIFLFLAVVRLVLAFFRMRRQRVTTFFRFLLQGIAPALLLLGQTSGRLALTFTVAYIVVALALWPLRVQMTHYIDDTIQRGSIAVWLDANPELNS